VLLAGAATAQAAAPVDGEAVRLAIVRAVEARLGPGVRPEVRDLDVRLASDASGSVFATVPQDARGGQPTRILLKTVEPGGRGVRYGEASCTIDVVVRGSRARRPLTRGTLLGAEDVEPADVELNGWPLRPLPDDLAGARVLTNVPAGQVVLRSMVAQAPFVRSGDEVTVSVINGPLLVQGKAIASQTGRLGDVIRVVTRENKRRVAARITGRGAVEVRHGS
jgi:flagella basal body P-ring formation protein FlgA